MLRLDQLDANKRGSSLEKTDRFPKEKAPHAPGKFDDLWQYSAHTFTGASNSMPKVAQKLLAAKHASDERYAILLKKLEDLEIVHADGKKAVR